VIGFVREVLTAAATGYLHGVQALDRPADRVDQHAAEVTELLGLRPDQQAELYRDHVAGLFTRETLAAVASAQQVVENALMAVEAQANAGSLEDQIAADTDAVITALHRAGRLREPGAEDSTLVEELRKKARLLGRDYGRASRTIAEQRGQLSVLRARLHDRELIQATAAGLSPSTAARATIAEALDLPPGATTGAIVVAIRGLREAAENPPIVEVAADKVSLSVAAAVDAREQIDRAEQRAEILRRDNDRLRAELDEVRETAWSLTRELERERQAHTLFRMSASGLAAECEQLAERQRPVGGHVNPYRSGEADTFTAVAERLRDALASGPAANGSVRAGTEPLDPGSFPVPARVNLQASDEQVARVIGWMTDRARVQMLAGEGDASTYGHARIIGIRDHPSVELELGNGRRRTWPLVLVAPAEDVAEQGSGVPS